MGVPVRNRGRWSEVQHVKKQWVYEKDADGDFIYFEGGTPGHDSRFEIYLPAEGKKRDDAIALIVNALNRSRIRI